MYLITNGIIITEEALLEGYDLLVQHDRIAKIVGQGECIVDANTEIIDACGGYIAPGLIDIHSDYIEHMTAPRPTSLIDFRLSLRETEKELIAHGITTMFHSLSIFKSVDYKYRPIREPENVRKLVDLIDETHNSKHLVRHRFHARFEIDNLDEIESLKSYIMEEKVHLLSFMDHTPGQGQYRDLEMYKKTIRGYEDVSDENVELIIANHQSKQKMTVDAIREIAEMAKARNIAVASHDDDSVEKLDLVQSFGTTISEFPITLEIARKAKEKGMFTIAGAPNVILGGSHSGNLSAAEAVNDGSIDILCSDYYPSAMLHAVFQLANQYEKSLAEMFKLVTLNPARAVNMDEQLGSIREGKKADLLIIERLEPDDFPVITAVMVDGKLIQKTNYRI
ncbi:alpha-D-ribose 1-methylphosphonate 5-triphosphate diphosphatase [Paenibacillus marchantiophytorum]|uniref:Alpha-D-ribose 1-methylphosphonate 5-triphosphate diphosphatase n=1 Tax=Paenibacillus marchantiophytorum TaxID=1619310 RepID=A0ABQ1ENG6_9BACL|nr:phosphonate metabolism protein PhnM [Paenibacillus marchantiophytorum]GFZ79965.1 alpha-D-ribose 1-methylphosphonate 5-triphosphate diphosphatase [Paenibacillus marchantiophytorum]